MPNITPSSYNALKMEFSNMPKGKIQKPIKEKSYGFIQTENGEEIFFHIKNLQGLDSKRIKKGAIVEFDIGKDEWDRPVAINVRDTDL
ncbi:MAG: cold-shock protein [Ignavibacteriales bacterium]